MSEANGTPNRNSPAAAAPPASQQEQPSASNENAQQQPSSFASSQPAPAHPSTSAQSQSGNVTKPRDARTLHLLLASLGVTSYQERVPLQLLDLAYRYTLATLSDAQHLAAEGYVGPSSSTGRGKANQQSGEEPGGISLQALRLATSARQGYQIANQALPKETMLEIAAERNRVRLPEITDAEGRDGIGQSRFAGIRLPNERFLLTGRSWDLKGEWDEEVDEDMTDAPKTNGAHAAVTQDEDMGEAEDEDVGTFEDVFGRDEGDEEGGMEEG